LASVPISCTTFVWAQRLRELLATGRLLSLSKEEFVEAMSTIHAVIDYGGKHADAKFGLSQTQRPRDLQVRLHTEQLWEARTEDAARARHQVFDYLLWGGGEVGRCIWAAARDPGWRLPWVQFSTLGEMLGRLTRMSSFSGTTAHRRACGPWVTPLREV
jgi:hypothetical protein